LLTEEEIEQLDCAVMESGALTRSLLVFEALKASLANSEIATLQRRSKRREVPIWITAELKSQVKDLARSHSVTQSLLRHLLFRYLSQAPWNEISVENREA